MALNSLDFSIHLEFTYYQFIIKFVTYKYHEEEIWKPLKSNQWFLLCNLAIILVCHVRQDYEC